MILKYKSDSNRYAHHMARRQKFIDAVHKLRSIPETTIRPGQLRDRLNLCDYWGSPGERERPILASLKTKKEEKKVSPQTDLFSADA